MGCFRKLHMVLLSWVMVWDLQCGSVISEDVLESSLKFYSLLYYSRILIAVLDPNQQSLGFL